MNSLLFEKSSWIWRNREYGQDEYTEFYFEFNRKNKNSDLFLNVSVDSDYAFYVNEKLVSFGQYPDFPHYKIYYNLVL